MATVDRLTVLAIYGVLIIVQAEHPIVTPIISNIKSESFNRISPLNAMAQLLHSYFGKRIP